MATALKLPALETRLSLPSAARYLELEVGPAQSVKVRPGSAFKCSPFSGKLHVKVADTNLVR